MLLLPRCSTSSCCYVGSDSEPFTRVSTSAAAPHVFFAFLDFTVLPEHCDLPHITVGVLTASVTATTTALRLIFII